MGLFSKKAGRIPVGTSRMPAASPTEARHHLLGERQRGGEARRFDAEQVYEPLESMLGGGIDHEIGGGFAWPGQLGADAGVVGHQRVVRQRRPVAPDRFVEALAAARIDSVV